MEEASVVVGFITPLHCIHGCDWWLAVQSMLQVTSECENVNTNINKTPPTAKKRSLNLLDT